MTPVSLTLTEELAYYKWKKDQRSAFRNQCIRLIDYYQTAFKSLSAEGSGYDYVKDILRSKFRTDEEYQLMVLNECIRRFPKFIIDKLSMVEKKKPNIEIHVGDKLDDELTALFESICNEMHLHQRFQQAEKYKNLLNTSFLKVSYDPELAEGMRWHAALLTPATVQVRARQGRADIFEAVLIEDVEQNPAGSNEEWDEATVYWFWSEDAHRKLDKDLKEIPQEDNDDGVNPYGIIPVVPLWTELPVDYPILPLPDDLQHFAEEMLAIQTANNSFQFMQGFAQLVAKGPPEAIKELEVKTGLVHVLKVISTGDDPAELEVLQYPDLLPSLIKFEQERLMQFALLYNLSPSNFIVSADAWSAQAIEMENAALLEKRENDIPMHTMAWEKVFEVIKAIADKEKLEKSFPKDAKLAVSYPDPQLPQTRAEKLEEIEREMALDLMTLAEAYQRLNPAVSDKQAEEAVQKIREERKAQQAPQLGASLEAKLAALRGDGDKKATLPPGKQSGGDGE